MKFQYQIAGIRYDVVEDSQTNRYTVHFGYGSYAEVTGWHSLVALMRKLVTR